jgi:putative tryptophan/tyrosine transport system substrate-binding protein
VRRVCNDAGIPIFTSEAGLVARGAVAAYGADFYLWGHQAGQQAARFLDSDGTEIPDLEQVTVRKKVYNPGVAEKFGLKAGTDFEPMGF